jgi:hypothetical protein
MLIAPKFGFSAHLSHALKAADGQLENVVRYQGYGTASTETESSLFTLEIASDSRHIGRHLSLQLHTARGIRATTCASGGSNCRTKTRVPCRKFNKRTAT